MDSKVITAQLALFSASEPELLLAEFQELIRSFHIYKSVMPSLKRMPLSAAVRH